MMQRIWLSLALVLLFLTQPSAPAKTYSAEQFNQAITVQHDGSLLVKETVIFTFSGGPFTFVYRNLPTDKTDGIDILSAQLDERTLPRGTQANQVEISTGNPIKVTWHFAPFSDQRHTMTLTYHVLGVIQKTASADLLNWEVLPTQYDYPIHSSTTTVTYPEQTTLTTPPQVTRGSAQITTSPGTTTFVAQNISAGSLLEIALNFRPGSIITIAPRWQQVQEQTQALILPCALGGLALFLVLFFFAFWHYRRYRQHPVAAGESADVSTTPPDDLSPALVGAILSPSNQQSWNSALATIFDLAHRGILVITQSSREKKWYESYPEFLIEQREQSADLRPSELGLLALLFQDKGHIRPSISITDLSKKYATRYRRFAKPLKQEMLDQGLLDPQLQHTRSWLSGISLSVAIVAFILAVVGVSIVGPLGLWPLIFLPIGVCLAASGMYILWLSLAPLTPQGRLEATQWKAFSHYLKETMRRREHLADAEIFGSYLVYTASFGIAEQWVKYFQRQGMMEVPPWFHSLTTANDQNMTSFVAMISATHVAGSASGGAGGGGAAAGGGASGAG